LSQSLTQSPIVGSINHLLQGVLGYFKQMPLAFWRGLVLLIAVIWLIRSAVSLFWLLFPIPELAQPTKLAAPIVAQAQSSGVSVSYDSVSRLKDVFGSYTPVAATKVEAKPVEVKEEDAKTTKLRLKLHGVIASNDAKQGSAIIADGSTQVLYFVDEEIEGNKGVKLAKVLQQRVILNNKGRMESLWLYSEDDFKAGPSRRASPKARQPSRSVSKASPRSTGNSTKATARADQIPKNIGDVVRFSVHREGGKMVGYRIRPGRDRELFNQVGLKANDIVTSVNGIEVNDPKQIRSVYKSMKTATEAQLSVLRNGDTHSITISLDSGE